MKKETKIVIQGSFCSLNEYINKERTNRFIAAKIKKDNTNLALIQLPNDLYFDKPISLTFNWFVKNKRKDPDNVAFSKKFVMDAIVKKGIIKNDGWNDIVSFRDNFFIDKEERVEVIIHTS